MTAFPARYAGICIKCRKDVNVGDLISWSRRKERRGVYHASCTGEFPASDSATPVETTATDEALAKLRAEAESSDDLAAIAEIEAEIEASKPKPAPAPVTASGDAFAVMAAALAPYLEDKLRSKVDESKLQELAAYVESKMSESADEAKLSQMITAALDGHAKRVIVENKVTGATMDVGVAHESFETLLLYMQLGMPVYLHGAAGSGKSHGAHQVATALELPYYYISMCPQTSETALFGFVRPDGTFQETDFFRAYTKGGVFCMDEADNASPQTQTALNSALENGKASFRCGIVNKHENFRFVATGNTTGKGGNRNYAGRSPFDTAFADRFLYLEWGYDQKLERKLARNINPESDTWVDWVFAVRSFAKTAYPQMAVTPRASYRGAELLKAGVKPSDAAEAVLFKGADKETVSRILNQVPLPVVKQEKSKAA